MPLQKFLVIHEFLWVSTNTLSVGCDLQQQYKISNFFKTNTILHSQSKSQRLIWILILYRKFMNILKLPIKQETFMKIDLSH